MATTPESNEHPDESTDLVETTELVEPIRHRLADTRRSITHHFSISSNQLDNTEDLDGYIVVGLFDDGRPGELFIKIAKQGSTISGLMNTIGILTSMALQYGVPIDAIARKLEYMRFEPSGRTSNDQIRQAQSLVDYIYRWLADTFGDT